MNGTERTRYKVKSIINLTDIYEAECRADTGPRITSSTSPSGREDEVCALERVNLISARH